MPQQWVNSGAVTMNVDTGPPAAQYGFGGRSLMRYLTVLWLAFVAAISMMPLRLKFRAGTTGAFHYPGHLLIFFATAMLLCRTASTFVWRIAGWVATCAFALVIEILEWRVYHNDFEWGDVLVDVCGAALALAVISVLPLLSADLNRTQADLSRDI